MITIGGENVYPSEVEGALSFHETIKKIAAIGVPDYKWGEPIKALAAMNEGYEEGEALAREIVNFARGKIAVTNCPILLTNAKLKISDQEP